MRKLKLQVQISVNGFVAGPNGEMDWLTCNWDDKIGDYVSELTDSVGTILLGRKMTDGFVKYWENAANNPEDPDFEFAKKMINYPKVVFSKTLDKCEWINTVIAKGDLTEEVSKLKKQKGKDMIVYGGSSFVSSLIKDGLIDEYYLFVNPAAVGKGLSIFSELNGPMKLKLIKSVPFDCGITLMQYEPVKN